MTTVAAVITAYHRKEYLAAALRSVLTQTDAPDEILVSKDFDDPEVDRLIVENGVISRRIGDYTIGDQAADALRHIRSDVVCFLDDDDVWYPDKVEVVREQFTIESGLGFLQHRTRHTGAFERTSSYMRPQPGDHEFWPLADGSVRQLSWLSHWGAYANMSCLSFARRALAQPLEDGVFGSVLALNDTVYPYLSMLDGGMHRFIDDVLSDYFFHDSSCRVINGGTTFVPNPVNVARELQTAIPVMDYIARRGATRMLPGRLIEASVLAQRAKLAMAKSDGATWTLTDTRRMLWSGVERLQPYIVRNACLALAGRIR